MSPTCPVCQSEHIHWLLHRVHTRETHHSQRSVHWACRSCGHEWDVPIDPAPGPLPDAAPA